ncbi:hypothetical protein HQ35_06775 [Porphyromonas cangingivalis]|uniref:Tetratricopeptide repeat-containing protein n=1 Tax=Porphyromonas cangingivalis TaxID=36874 RepID=A0A0A2EQD9_PORCN|nr:hypothetical protein [Porphyromonas cangingivalis]KGN79705.1 hypothetical protein HQ35_06775 [Porphyromonas cangingivalis]
MKTLRSITLCLLLCLPLISQARESEYAEAMTDRVLQLESATKEKLQALAVDFARFSTLQGSDWLAPYYAAYCKVILALKDPSEADILTEEAMKYITQAESANGAPSELACLKSLVATARMLVDPQSRWEHDGAESQKQQEIALETNPQNPRAHLLKAQTLAYTPEAFGGGKDKALLFVQKALALYQAESPSPAYAPQWGHRQAVELEAYCSK